MKQRKTLAIWRGFLLPLGAVIGSLYSVQAEEVQSHGHRFEHAVIQQITGLEHLPISYTSEWDIPAEFNKKTGLPISIKFIRWGNSIYLGDALRQRTSRQPFEMILGFYEIDSTKKSALLQAIYHLSFKPEDWDRWWGQVSAAEIESLINGIKKKPLAEAQAYARKEAKRLLAKEGIIDINPKVNKDQRRIQCSIPFELFYSEIIKEKQLAQKNIELDGKSFPKTLKLGVRSRME